MQEGALIAAHLDVLGPQPCDEATKGGNALTREREAIAGIARRLVGVAQTLADQPRLEMLGTLAQGRPPYLYITRRLDPEQQPHAIKIFEMRRQIGEPFWREERGGDRQIRRPQYVLAGAVQRPAEDPPECRRQRIAVAVVDKFGCVVHARCFCR